ncbi:MAG TPA: two-component sensor histidine kinase [Firmicutes bacterium]|nr:two-component sensor histidine kinase [Bacillota bacterium]
MKYIRPVFIIINLTLWYLIIRYMGIGIFGIFIAVLISIGGVYEIFFLWRLEKRVFNPIDQLKKGVEEIARGNYGVRIECDVLNDITLLVVSFNQMAQKLQEGEKVKVEYEENRKDLLANISHDLKTPITSIQGYIEAILERTDLGREELRRYLQIIYHNTAYMNKLIDDLFLFSKLDLDKLEFRFEKIPFRNFMSDLMEELGLELAEKQIEFSYRDNLALECIVNIDRKRIHQAVRNIIGNAIKYGPETGLRIDTTISRQNNRVIIEIQDNGSGIPTEKLPYIFERFYRIDAERTKDDVSTGLGLAITRELVEAHDGRISVSSVLNAGSCFTIELPLVEGLGENEL